MYGSYIRRSIADVKRARGEKILVIDADGFKLGWKSFIAYDDGTLGMISGVGGKKGAS